MAIIKVIRGGCGIVYTDANGNARHALKTPESGPFECDNAQAARLITLGMAEYVGLQWEEEANDSQESERGTGVLDAESLEELTVDKLKTLAADMGVDVSGCKKRADYIAAIVAAEVEPGDEDNGDELPEMSAADPE